MTLTIQKAKDQIRTFISAAAQNAQADGSLPAGELSAFNIEVPADKANGDYSTNAAMVNARTLRLPPRKIAEALTAHMDLTDSYFSRVEVAGPGFINFYFSPAYYADVLLDVRKAGKEYGRTSESY